ncbi:protein of unknown function [Pustulibacterium marinum]|uniref:DUF4249 domain-containing protein n=1 Tax=Pustulibacterium marinum TaxID=1224947 RepID=A0A1I7ETG1_9FLAO|nr:DUF4249 domain-containing protein [Pustulibacterium marinum]SFU27227.1 protein of unknown function [Pustulibacterium marinum]
MKFNIKSIFVLVVCISFTACTDVVDVDVPFEGSNLVIEASMDWLNGTSGNEQTIYLSESTPYFSEDQISPVSGATISVVNDATGETYIFEDQNDGSYTTTSFEPVENQSFTLTVVYDNETYQASDTFILPTAIDYVEQTLEGAFDDEVIDLNTYFQDDAEVDNYYMNRYYRQGDLFPYLDTFSDEFTNGNQMHDFFEIEDDEDSTIEPLQAGDVVDIYLYSITESYYNYMTLLLEQSESSGNPFATTPAALQGNCKNMSDGEDAYGYFRTTRYDKVTYTVE